MNPQDAKKNLDDLKVEKFIAGYRLEDGNLVFDCCATVSEKDFNKEIQRFALTRIFELKEIK